MKHEKDPTASGSHLVLFLSVHYRKVSSRDTALHSRVQPARASKSSVPGVADLPQHSLSTPKLGAVHKSCPHFGYFSETLFIWEAYTADCSSKCGRSSSSRPVKKMSFSCHGMQRVLRLQVVQYLLRSHSLPLHLNGVEGYSH